MVSPLKGDSPARVRSFGPVEKLVSMLHLKLVARALAGNARRQLRRAMGLQAKPRAPVLSGDIYRAVERHSTICRTYLGILPCGWNSQPLRVCEAGPGDCLGTAAMFLALGAENVTLVELEQPVVNERQLEILGELKKQRIPIDETLIRQEGSAPQLDSARVSYCRMPMDQFDNNVGYGLVCSYSVLEHVENLSTFFRTCYNVTAKGGLNLHVFDLGGHGMFEDPIPPLDFQCYPDWLYNLMYPTFHRATRRFRSEYIQRLEEAGFTIDSVTPLRTVDEEYYKQISSSLRPAARSVPEEELRVIELAVLCRRPV